MTFYDARRWDKAMTLAQLGKVRLLIVIDDLPLNLFLRWPRVGIHGLLLLHWDLLQLHEGSYLYRQHLWIL
jgi:hypothetical protein